MAPGPAAVLRDVLVPARNPGASFWLMLVSERAGELEVHFAVQELGSRKPHH
jgi:hypothetical protein